MADIGGGTSDFTVIRIGPGRARARPIARTTSSPSPACAWAARISIREISLDAVMPLLGRGSPLIEKGMTMPNALYRELATWATINFTYSYRNEREVTQLMREAQRAGEDRPAAEGRCTIASAIASPSPPRRRRSPSARATASTCRWNSSKPGCMRPATRAGLDRAIRRGVERIGRAAADCVAAAGLRPGDIETIFFTGGSSRVPAVRAAISRAAPAARAMTGNDLLSVAWGLTQEATRRFA